MLSRRAALSPHAEAFIWLENGEREAGRLTFSHLDRRARAIAGLALARNLAGERVLLAISDGLELLAALFGCFYAGATAVVAPPLSSRSAVERLRSIVADSSAAAVLAPENLVAELGAQLPIHLQVMSIGSVEDEAASAMVSARDDALAMLQYTSGSTASPRGVMLTHANVLANLRALASASDFCEGETAVSWLPLHHDMGLHGFGLFPVFAGMRAVMMPPTAFLKHPARWLQAIDRYHAVLSAAPCFAFDLCRRRVPREARSTLDLSSWRVAVCGGETVRPDVLRGFSEAFAPSGYRHKAFTPAYGLAEATVLATSPRAGTGFATQCVDARSLAEGKVLAPASSGRARELVVCGVPWSGEVAIVDPNHAKKIPPGHVGEIWLRGPSVAAGYWGRPSETADTFEARLGETQGQTWLRTGDVGYMCDGGLVVTGRRKDMIIVRGANFDPLDLELAANRSHSALEGAAAAAFSANADDGEQVVLALEVERVTAQRPDTGEIVAGVVETLAAEFGLTLFDLAIVRSGALPRTTSGKIQRHRCRVEYLNGGLRPLIESRHPALGRWRPSRP